MDSMRLKPDSLPTVREAQQYADYLPEGIALSEASEDEITRAVWEGRAVDAGWRWNEHTQAWTAEGSDYVISSRRLPEYAPYLEHLRLRQQANGGQPLVIGRDI